MYDLSFIQDSRIDSIQLIVDDITSIILLVNDKSIVDNIDYDYTFISSNQIQVFINT